MAARAAAARRAAEPGAARLVAQGLEQVLRGNPNPDPSLLKNLGVASQFLSRAEPGRREWHERMTSAWTRYLVLAPADDDELPTIRELLKR